MLIDKIKTERREKQIYKVKHNYDGFVQKSKARTRIKYPPQAQKQHHEIVILDPDPIKADPDCYVTFQLFVET